MSTVDNRRVGLHTKITILPSTTHPFKSIKMPPSKEVVDNDGFNESKTLADATAEKPLSSSVTMSLLKLALASVFLLSAVSIFQSHAYSGSFSHRRLTQTSLGDTVPSYMGSLFQELKERKKLMEETPPEEVKYWFEYAGPLQVSYPQLKLC